MAAPVLRAPSERVFGTGSIVGREDPNRDPLIVIEQFRAGHVSTPYLQPLTDLPGRALAGVVGPVAAYNVLVLASFPLAAAAAYLLARHLLGSHLGAMVAALAYAFLPFHVTQAAGHPHIAQTQWIPLYFLALWRCVDRPDMRRAAWLLASVAAVALSNFYGGLIAAALSPVALVAYGLASPGDRRLRRVALTAVVLASAAAAGVLLIHGFAPAVRSIPFVRSDLFAWSAKWWSYLVPPADHPLWGATIREFWGRHGVDARLLEHHQVGLGWSLLVLAMVPLVRWARGDHSSPAIRNAPVLASVAGAALLCSLSPERAIGPVTFVRPSAVFYVIAPMFRAYSRFGVVVGLMTALLAGAGVACLWRRPGAAGRYAAVVLLALAAFELAPLPPRWRDVLPTSGHRWLASQPRPLRVLDCVAPVRGSDTLALPLLGHEASLLGGGFDDCGEPRLADKLAAMAYTHVLARRGSATAEWLATHPAEGLERGPELEDAAVLGVIAVPPPAYVSALIGFYPREYDSKATWRWMGQTGALRLVARREVPATVVELEMRAFPGLRTVEWFVDGRRRGAVDVTAEWRRYELPLGALSPGETMLTLACPTPAVVANDILRNDDPRALGIAVGDWKIASAGAASAMAPSR